ncbi:peptidoglycan-binding protein [Nitratireductor mangrovi]|nr:peptidoglycan-binding protein [Nitratireductor mangrovi]
MAATAFSFSYPRRPARRSSKPLAIATALLLGSTALVPAFAQETLSPGEAFATRFSGTTEITLADGTRLTLIDETGVVASAVDVRSPGYAADGRHWIDEPQHLQVTAGDVGQVFGIAIDDGAPANVYLTATSQFGLHRDPDNTDWLPGQFGDGGPGGVYVLKGDNGFAPELLTTITLDGRENTGAGLGNVAFDKAHGQLFVSDLETGMVHRLSLDGTEIDRFDHGVDGRAAFLDAITGENSTLAQIAFDPASTAAIDDCKDAGGADASFAATPSCWNYADFRRRVFGLAVFTNPLTNETRLYYAVAGGDGMGNPDWEAGSEDAQNTVWSVGLDENGGFDTADVRREIVLPEFGGDDATPRSVPDIAVSEGGVMLVGERGGVRNLGLDQPQPFAHPHAARVIQYTLVEDGFWVPLGRYDVGFNDRKTIGAPHIRANAAGGVDFGFGYDTNGAIDPERPYGSVWLSGDSLCSPDGPCTEPASGERTDIGEAHGIQGTPVEALDEVLPETALGAYPATGEPYPADALLASYMIDLDINVDENGNPLAVEALKHDATKIGDVEIVRGGPGAPAPDEPPAPQPQGYDLDIDKTGAEECLPGTDCNFTITLTNNGPADFSGPVYLWDVVEPEAAPLVDVIGTGWNCFDLGSGIQCYNPEVTLGVGESIEFALTLSIPDGYGSDLLTNCIGIQWLYAEDGSVDARPIQIALTLYGYDPGPIDGIFGPQTQAAIEQLQADNGLDPTGELDDETLALLYPGMVGIIGDLDSSNDLDCHDVETGEPTPIHSKWKSHLKTGSPHNKAQSHLKTGSPHNKLQSHLKTGSPHNKLQSHLKTGSPHNKLQSHLKTGSPHNKLQSHLKTGSPHNKAQSHLKTGSPHNKLQSHLKTGSPHNKLQSHLKTGSPHNKLQSHLKTGSPHNKAQSHLKTGSPHNKLQSHLKTGSPHNKLQSHLKTGSPHNKLQSHLKTGSPHNKLQSHLKTGSPHNKAQSHLKTGSPHNKLQSHLKTGSPHNKLQSHLKTGSPHNKAQSHLKTGSPHNKAQSHLKTGSPHNKLQSHLKTGSPHNKAQSHLKTGSPHNKLQSHLKTGSPHNKAQSHLKTGSPHNKAQSHLKTGSPHNKLQSHLKTGSPHNKAQSHLKTGSPHNKTQSHLKTGSPHKKVQSHLKTGSPHNKLQSHNKSGSIKPHNKAESHNKIGSIKPHNKAQSHNKSGSIKPHNKAQSHNKTGSVTPHNKLQSHLKKGSLTEKPPAILPKL